MPRPWLALAPLALLGCGRAPSPPPGPALPPISPGLLRAVSDFDVIPDRAARSRALFVEAARVLLHPRCVNCHPDGDAPHQGMASTPHDPPVTRGRDGHGVVGMECGSCHQERNQPLSRVPGAPRWHLAPLAMAWQGRTAGQVCRQLKDPRRNGGKTIAQIVEHSAHDALVAWGWEPGAGREKVPGTQAELGALMQAWAATGAACPEEPR